jgi:brefeldin A-inhibited guanine nucleotide-exchange protein
MKSHLFIFTLKSKALLEDPSLEPVMFIESVKEFLLMALSRNSISLVPPVSDISIQIFGILLVGLRSHLKKEMEVFFTEIIIPILEGGRKNISWHQRYLMFKALESILKNCDGGRILVELFVNYDCDVGASAKENIWERLINAVTKTLSHHNESSSQPEFIPVNYFATTPTHAGETPALTTSNLVVLSKEQVKEITSPTGDMVELKKTGVDLLVGSILVSLVSWCNAKNIKKMGILGIMKTENADNMECDKTNVNNVAQIEETEEGVADPLAFGNMKIKKQAIIEAVRKFNFKPKKGIQYLLETKCILSKDPKEIAQFLLTAEGLNKSMIGEYLGEGYYNSIMV